MDQTFDNKLKISDINTEKLDGDTMEDPDDAPLMSEFEIECFDDETNEVETITENFDGLKENIRRYSEECKGCYKDSKSCDCLKVNTAECIICHKIFDWTSRLVDAVEKPNTCSTCMSPISQNSILANKLYECNICGKSLQSSAGMYKHKKKHTEGKRFECEICHKKFTEKTSLHDHVRIHTGEKPFVCSFPDCHKEFRQKSIFVKHTKIHTGDKHTSGKVFNCPICDETFASKNYVTKHIRIHTKEKQLQCKACCIKFAKQETLTEHLKIHTSSEESFSELKIEDSIDIVEESLSDRKNEYVDIKMIKCETLDDEAETELNEGKSSWLNQLTGNDTVTHTHSEKQPFKCSICNKDLKRCECLKINTGECSLCFKKLCWMSKVGDTNAHQSVCTSCNPENPEIETDETTFLNTDDISNHTEEKLFTRKHPKKVYKCPICKKSSAILNSVRKHLLIHIKEKFYNSGICYKKFKQKNQRKRFIPTIQHCKTSMLNYHNYSIFGKPFATTIRQTCHRKFRRKQSLTRHSKFHRKEAKLSGKSKGSVLIAVECKVCHQTFYWTRLVDTDEKPSTCAACIKSGEPSHNDEKPFECDICHKKFTTNSSLQYHSKSHTEERPFVCSYADCRKAFKHQSRLTHHIKFVHTKEKKYAVCQCTICGKSIKNSGNVKTHMRTHTGEKPYECEVCYKRFAERGILKYHLGIHTGEKPYVCPVQDCLKAFRHRMSLKSHTKNSHQEDIKIIKCETFDEVTEDIKIDV